MQNEKPSFLQRVAKIIGSRGFFIAILVLFVSQAGWIAVSSQFPQAYDEGYHYGLIQVYSHQWSPLIHHQAADTYSLGEITRYPSYFYHYLMSFPYRVLAKFFYSQDSIIIALRFINIAFLAGAVIAFRRVLLTIKPSRALVHTTLFAFVALPITPYLAAQINYDNLLLLLTSISVLLTMQFIVDLHKINTFNTTRLMQFVIVTCLASITKYSYLPILVALSASILVSVYLWRKQTKQSVLKTFANSFTKLSLPVKIALVGLLIISSGLFVERLGYNAAVYKDPDPACQRILSSQACSHYNVWQRNYTLAHTHTPHVDTRQILQFGKVWYASTTHGLFTVFDAHSEIPAQPFKVLRRTSVAIAGVGMLLIMLNWRSMRKLGYPLWISIGATAVYLSVLLTHNYSDFTHYGVPVAIQGRYLLPILPIIMLLICIGFSYALKNRHTIKALLLVLVFALFTQGGGALTYISRSDETWYRNNATVINMNSSANTFLKRIVVLK